MTEPNGPHAFTGRNTREAFARVRAALGKDAVILEQHRQGGMVRVVAAADYPEPDPAAGQPLAGRLASLGFEPAFVDLLPPAVSSWAELQTVLLEKIPLVPAGATMCGTMRFVGAPGAGKTTLIIKLMAEHVLRHGRAGCLLVSSDCHRLAGTEQLALAAELLGVPFLEVAADDLGRTLGERQADLVLIDSPGIAAAVPALPGPEGCQDVLVVSAAWQPGALRKLGRQLDLSRIQSIALTQIDQAETLGGALGVISGWGRPLRWLSSGPEVYDDLKPATGKMLAGMLHQGIDQPQMSTTFS